MSAVLQFEIDRERLDRYPLANLYDRSGLERASAAKTARQLILAAMWDTLDLGGTFVLVVSPEKITVVQRREAEEAGGDAWGSEENPDEVLPDQRRPARGDRARGEGSA